MAEQSSQDVVNQSVSEGEPKLTSTSTSDVNDAQKNEFDNATLKDGAGDAAAAASGGGNATGTEQKAKAEASSSVTAANATQTTTADAPAPSAEQTTSNIATAQNTSDTTTTTAAAPAPAPAAPKPDNTTETKHDKEASSTTDSSEATQGSADANTASTSAQSGPSTSSGGGSSARTSSSKRKPMSFAKFSINKSPVVAGPAAAAGTTGATKEKGNFLMTSSSISSTSSPAAGTSRPRLVAKTGSGLSSSLPKSSAGAAAPGAVWNKNKIPQPQAQPLAPATARNLTDEELRERYGIHMATRLPSQPPAAAGGTSMDGAGHPEAQHSQWADEEEEDDDWTPQTIAWADGTKVMIAPHKGDGKDATTIVKVRSDGAGEEVVVGSTSEKEKEWERERELEREREKEKEREKERERERERERLAAPPVRTTTKLSAGTSVLKLGQATSAASTNRANESAATAQKAPAPSTTKSPWAPLPPVEKVSPAALAAEAAKNKEHRGPTFSQHHFEDRERFSHHGYSGDARHYGERHPRHPEGFRERDFPHAFSNVRDPALQPFAEPPLPSEREHGRYHHGHIPPREIAADDFNRNWKDEPAMNGPRELFNSRSGRYEVVEPGARTHEHHRREKPDRERGDRRPTHLLQRPPTDEKGIDERGFGRRRADSIVSATSGRLSMHPPTDRTRSISPEKAAFALTPAMEQAPAQPPAEAAPEEDPVALQQRIMKERQALARQRRKEEEEREEAAKQERIRQKLAAMGPPPVSKSQKEKEKASPSPSTATPAASVKTPEQAVVTPVMQAASVSVQSPPRPPVVEPSGAPKQYGLMKVHAPETVRRKSIEHREAEAMQREHAQHAQPAQANPQQQPQAEPKSPWQPPSQAARSPPAAPEVVSPAQPQPVAPSTTTVPPFAPWTAPTPKLSPPGPASLWSSPHTDRGLGNGTFDRNFAGFRREGPGVAVVAGPAGVHPPGATHPQTPLGVPTSMALDGLTSSPLSPETRSVEHLQPIGHPAGPIGAPVPPQHQQQQQRAHHHRSPPDLRGRSPQLTAWHNFHNVVAEAEAKESERHHREMKALKEEEARNGGPRAAPGLTMKFNQTWRKVEVGDEVDRQVVGVSMSEKDMGQAQRQAQAAATPAGPAVPAIPVASPATAPITAPLSTLHGFGSVAGFPTFPENATARPLASNTGRESRFFPHGGNDKRNVAATKTPTPPAPVAPLSVPGGLPAIANTIASTPVHMSNLLSPLVSCCTPSPPPPDGYASAHPAYTMDSTRPLVHLPPQKPVVRLPPSQPQQTSAPYHALEASPPFARPHSRHYPAAHPRQVQGSPSHFGLLSSPQSRATRAQIDSSWQERIDGLLGKRTPMSPSAPLATSPPTWGSMPVISSSTREPYEDTTTPAPAAVSLPQYAESEYVDASAKTTLQVTSKDVEAEEAIFEDREAGSLPVVKVPDMAPPRAWEPAMPPPEMRSRSRFFKPVQSTSKDPFTVANLMPEGGTSTIVVKFPSMTEPKAVYLPRGRGYGQGRGRGGYRGRRGGKGRDGVPPFERRGNQNSTSSNSVTANEGPQASRWSRQPPSAPETAKTSPSTAASAAKSASAAPPAPKPAPPPSAEPMTWASRVARGA